MSQSQQKDHNYSKQFESEVLQRLTRIETQQTDILLPTVNLVAKHERVINWAKGVGATLSLLWAALLAWFIHKRP